MYPQSETSPCHKHTMKQHTGHKASSTLPLVGASHATPANPQDASLPWRGPWWRWLTHSDLNFQPILKQDSPALNCPEALAWPWGQEKNPTATWVSSEIIQRHETPSRSGPLEPVVPHFCWWHQPPWLVSSPWWRENLWLVLQSWQEEEIATCYFAHVYTLEIRRTKCVCVSYTPSILYIKIQETLLLLPKILPATWHVTYPLPLHLCPNLRPLQSTKSRM